MRALGRLLRRAAPLRWWLVGAALLGSATILSSVALMGAAAFIVATAALRPSIAELHVAIAGVRFFGLARGILRYLERLASHNATLRFLLDLRLWFFRALTRRPPAERALRSGDLLDRWLGTMDALESFLARSLHAPAVALITAVALFFIVAAYAPAAAWIALLFFALSAFVLPLLFVPGVARRTRDLDAARAAHSAAWSDAVHGLPELSVLALEPRVQRDMHHHQTVMARLQRRFARLLAWNLAGESLIRDLGLVLMLALVAPQVGSGVDGVDLTVIVLVYLAAFEAVQPMTQVAVQWHSHAQAAERVLEVGDEVPQRAAAEVILATRDEGMDVALEATRFTYPRAAAPVLADLSLRCAPGQWVALVGESGTGKSTLARLLLRLQTPQQGRISLDGQLLETIQDDSLYRQVAWVGQDTRLFGATVAENLRLAAPGCEASQVQAALQAFGLEAILARFPQGLSLPLHDNGAPLSVGQGQRLSLAMAVLRQPRLLILDEATSALDAIAEAEVYAALRRCLPQATVLCITHRINALEHFDQVALVAQGRICEAGDAASLLALPHGRFRQAWLAQRLWS